MHKSLPNNHLHHSDHCWIFCLLFSGIDRLRGFGIPTNVFVSVTKTEWGKGGIPLCTHMFWHTCPEDLEGDMAQIKKGSDPNHHSPCAIIVDYLTRINFFTELLKASIV
jgi:hypothetical protein